MILEKACDRCFPLEKQSENTFFCFETLIYQNKTIVMTLFTHFDVTGVYLLHTYLNRISAIVYAFLKLSTELQFWGL